MSAVLSPCGIYRYRLERTIDYGILESTEVVQSEFLGKTIAFFGINPSTADANLNDATVRKWIGFCKRWGAKRFIVGNVWPLRATDVRQLATATRWIGIAYENQRHILKISEEADILVPCWGDRKKVPRLMHNELDELMSLLIGTGKPVMHLGKTASGDPKHPLMLRYDTPLTPWSDQP